MKTQTETERKRLWVVSEVYYPEETSTGYYLTRIAEGLSDGFDVHVLCAQPNYFARGSVAPKRERRNGVEIYRVGATRLNKNVILFRLINMLTVSLSVFVRAIGNFRKGDSVLVVTNPPSMPFVAAAASLIKGAGYTLLIHDNYPEILIAAGKSRENSLLTRFLNLCNRGLYKYASKIIVVGRDMKELILRKSDGLDIPVETIPNWAELEVVHPTARDDNKLLKELGFSDKFVFLYAGNMGYPNDLESIVRCAEKLIDRPEFHFLFLGAGAKREWLEREVKENDLHNVTILPPQPRNEQTTFLNACDVALVSLVGKMLGVSVPSRTYNILAAGKPILALTEENSEVSRVIAEENVGWVVHPGEPDELAEVILQIHARRDELGAMGERAHAAALQKYSLQVAIERYSDALMHNRIETER